MPCAPWSFALNELIPCCLRIKDECCNRPTINAWSLEDPPCCMMPCFVHLTHQCSCLCTDADLIATIFVALYLLVYDALLLIVLSTLIGITCLRKGSLDKTIRIGLKFSLTLHLMSSTFKAFLLSIDLTQLMELKMPDAMMRSRGSGHRLDVTRK